MYLFSPLPGRSGLHCDRGADPEVQAGNGPAAQGPASRFLHPMAPQHPQPRHYPGILSPSASVHQIRSLGPKAGGDPTRLFLNIIVSKASHYMGNWELFCR